MHCALEALADQKKCDNAPDKKEQQYEYRRLTIGEIHSLHRSLRVQDDGCSTRLRLACYLTECIKKRSCLIKRFIGRCFVRCLCDQHSNAYSLCLHRNYPRVDSYATPSVSDERIKVQFDDFGMPMDKTREAYNLMRNEWYIYACDNRSMA